MALFAGLLVAIPLADTPAEASVNVVEIPTAYYFDMEYDDDHELIFISDRIDQNVYVYDLDGQLVETIGQLDKPHGLAVSPDGTTLWVALPEEYVVAKIDIATFTIVEQIVLPDGVCPGHIAQTGTSVAVAHSCFDYGTSNEQGGFGVIDLADSNAWQSIDYDDVYHPSVHGSPGLADLVIFSPEAGGPVDLYDVSSGGPVVVIAGTTHRGARSITADGQSALGVPMDGVLAVYDLPSFERQEIYGFFKYTGHAVWAVDSDFIVFTRDREFIDVFDVAAEEVVATYSLSHSEEVLEVAATTGAEIVIFLTEVSRGDPLRLNIVERANPEYTCFGEPATIVGTEGDDNIELTSAHDVVVALGGNDRIYRPNNGDLICAGDGDDTISLPDETVRVRGGSGSDWVSYESSNYRDSVVLDLRAEWYPGAPFPDLISVENINGSRQADVLSGDDGKNFIRGAGGQDVIYGRGGNDKLHGANTRDTIYGGLGDDRIRGYGGNDVLRGGHGDDWLRGGSENDTLVGGPGDDLLEGENHGDTLDGGSGDDELSGGPGRDLLLGGSGADVLRGNSDDDTLAGERGPDQLFGGTGTDTASFAFAPAGVYVSLRDGFARGEGRDSIASSEWIVGSERADHLIGDSGPNLIESRGGDDSVEALGGDDLIHAGDGTDTIHAGTGNDWCIAGEVTLGCETDEPAAELDHKAPTVATRYQLDWGPR